VKKYILIILTILGFVWYFLDNPTMRLNRAYNLDLSIFHTKKIIWNEEWISKGDGEVVGLLEISHDDFLRLSKMCLSSKLDLSNESILSTYKYICSIKHEENSEDIILLLLLEKQSSKYLFYKLSLQ